MARILDTSTNRLHPLRAHHTFGRSADNVDTLVTNPLASRIHAAFEWNDCSWQIRDLSRNGTWVRGERIAPGEGVEVAAGDVIQFGSPEGAAWKFADDSAPQSLLLADSGVSSTIELEEYLFLPDEDNPELIVTYSQNRRCWLSHYVDENNSQHAGTVLEHGELLSCNGQRWKAFIAETENATEVYPPAQNKLDEFEFVFDLSLDEENTILHLTRQQQTLDMGERTHHYLLVHLARLRAMAAQNGLDYKTQGWIDNEQLTKDLGMEMSHINILIYRARKQLADTLEASLESEHLVERGKGRVRFGCPRFKIFKGQQLAYQMPLQDVVLH